VVSPVKPAVFGAPGPLVVADVRVVCPEGFLEGSDYEVELVLNRSLDVYEERLISQLRPFGFMPEGGGRLRTWTEVDELDPHAILDMLSTVSARAAQQRQDAAEEQERLTAHAQRLKGVLRPNS
jgi:ATP-dependent protease Clp ATPase subunit